MVARTRGPSDHLPGRDGPGPRFVVHRHRATRLHYDLRLEIDGVLASWAVPKGPTLDPAVRRAAIQVDDHALDYVDFEGTIPAGSYGGGDVIVLDTGTWAPHDAPDPGRVVRDGELHVDLYGVKLTGRFVLIRRTRVDAAGKQEWLLLHKRDDHAVDGWQTEDYPGRSDRPHQRRRPGWQAPTRRRAGVTEV